MSCSIGYLMEDGAKQCMRLYGSARDIRNGMTVNARARKPPDVPVKSGKTTTNRRRRTNMLQQTACKDYLGMDEVIKPRFIHFTVGYSTVVGAAVESIFMKFPLVTRCSYLSCHGLGLQFGTRHCRPESLDP